MLRASPIRIVEKKAQQHLQSSMTTNEYRRSSTRSLHSPRNPLMAQKWHKKTISSTRLHRFVTKSSTVNHCGSASASSCRGPSPLAESLSSRSLAFQGQETSCVSRRTTRKVR
jgi:hypothetical protein